MASKNGVLKLKGVHEFSCGRLDCGTYAGCSANNVNANDGLECATSEISEFSA